MKVLHGWLQGYFEKPIPTTEQLEELFTFHSFEVEGLEKGPDAKSGDCSGDVLDVKILPDRAHYCLSHTGIALEISVLTKQPFKPNRIPSGPADTLTKKPEVRIEAPNFCRRYMARYGEIAKVAPSNPHATAMLSAIGQRAINAVVDATNITMFDCGQPLHIFDADQIKGAIVIRAAKKDEKITLLDSAVGGLADREVELLETDHVIADDLGPIAIAGVKGGKRAGVSDATRRIIVESANFEPAAVRRTATRLNLRSESSKRYENEITPELTAEGMSSVCALVKHNMPEAAFGPVVDIYPAPAVKRTIDLDPWMISNRLGVEVPLAEAKDILTRLQIGVTEKSGTQGAGTLWQLTIPFNRFDLTIPEDMVEEVGRVYGYDKITGILPPPDAGDLEVLPEFYVSEKIRNELVSIGYSEVMLYSLVSKGHLETAYPLAKDKSFARVNLTDGLLQCLEKNYLNKDLLGLHEVHIFEIGHTFNKDGERLMLGLGVAGTKKGWKGDVDINIVLDGFGWPKENRNIISKGLLHVCEIDITELCKTWIIPASYADLGFGPASTAVYKKFSAYPFITRDIAVFVPESITAEAVWNEIMKGITTAKAANILARHALFDTFKKDGKTSYAFRMIFQSMDRTLTDVETGAVMDAVYAAVRAQNWEVR